MIDLETTEWKRDDWRNAAYRWHCTGCGRYGPYDVTPMAVAKAAIEHQVRCEGS